MLFASDLDGTLLTETHMVDDYILKGINCILNKGHYFVICTGRSMNTKEEVNFGIENKRMFTIAKNGSVIYNSDFEIIHSTPLKKEAVALFMDSFPEIFVRFESDKMSYYSYSEKEALSYLERENLYPNNRQQRMEFYKLNAKFCASKVEIINSKIYKINFSLNNKDIRKKVDDFLALHRDLYQDAPWGDGFSDITDASANKANATKWLADYLKIDYDDTYVYGDAYNDIELIEEFKNSFVPSNGLEILKEKASKVLGLNDDYSVIDDMLDKIDQ